MTSRARLTVVACAARAACVAGGALALSCGAGRLADESAPASDGGLEAPSRRPGPGLASFPQPREIVNSGGIPDADFERIKLAAPESATAVPRRRRKLLVFTLCRAFRHPSIPAGTAAVEVMGMKTGAYETDVSDDVSVFRREILAEYDAVFMNSTTGELFEGLSEEQELKGSLLDFVAKGKGLVGIHGASDCFYSWPEYAEMLGARYWGHPWGPRDTVAIKVDDPRHALTAAFGGRGFEVTDEIYQFRDPYSREKLRVLLSIDTTKTNMNKIGIRRKDGDFAVSWIRSYGKGRVFYCSLGNGKDIFCDGAILKHLLDGIQFAMGDLRADATPSARLGR